ncbi:hypothetical protein [Bacillus sp. ISL-7]|uniref:hypothetical protein n=1 Tax=Bacillus sp. ISL-7 TaxID=2819136 RepID=UPI001BE71463|nr:hypothetical protein [Bacillus sp. ISL-7]MBT2734108.1 hypothetical protein [Bacillus sp. ISL-7]
MSKISKKFLVGVVIFISLITVCLIVVNITKDIPQAGEISNGTKESKNLTQLINVMKDELKDYKEIREIKSQKDKVLIATTIDSSNVDNAAKLSDQIWEKLIQLHKQDVVSFSYFVEINDKAGQVISGMQFEN